jgi:hypothetical protein
MAPLRPDDEGIRVEILEATSESYVDAAELANAFGSSVLEPTWWPEDAEEISYTLDRFPNHASYRVGGVRHDGVPIAVIGHPKRVGRGRSPREWLVGEWDEPNELAHLSGLIGRVGNPVHLQAFLEDGAVSVVMIGFDTEPEISQAVSSFRRALAR